MKQVTNPAPDQYLVHVKGQRPVEGVAVYHYNAYWACEKCEVLSGSTRPACIHIALAKKESFKMTMVEYPRGYGRRDPVPVCDYIPRTLDCPCCKGQAEHSYGAGMDSDAVDCTPCAGSGYFFLKKVKKADEA